MQCSFSHLETWVQGSNCALGHKKPVFHGSLYGEKEVDKMDYKVSWHMYNSVGAETAAMGHVHMDISSHMGLIKVSLPA